MARRIPARRKSIVPLSNRLVDSTMSPSHVIMTALSMFISCLRLALAASLQARLRTHAAPPRNTTAFSNGFNLPTRHATYHTYPTFTDDHSLGSLRPLSVDTLVPVRFQLPHDDSIASLPPNQLPISPPAFVPIYPIQHSWFSGGLSTILFLLSIA